MIRLICATYRNRQNSIFIVDIAVNKKFTKLPIEEPGDVYKVQPPEFLAANPDFIINFEICHFLIFQY